MGLNQALALKINTKKGCVAKMKSITASDRTALIKLASGLPKGDANRRAILAAVKPNLSKDALFAKTVKEETRLKTNPKFHEVLSSPEALITRAADCWTVENLGQSWPLMSVNKMYDEDGIDGELRHWQKEAKKAVAALVARDLPLTLVNAWGALIAYT